MALTLAEIEKTLADATTEYAEAEKAEGLARARATDALNRLNRAQKEFDKRLAEIREKAPQRSDWRQDARRAAMTRDANSHNYHTGE